MKNRGLIGAAIRSGLIGLVSVKLTHNNNAVRIFFYKLLIKFVCISSNCSTDLFLRKSIAV